MDRYWHPVVTDLAYRPGMVESYFLKLHDPAGDLAVWIKYTFLRRARGHQPLGEVWCILFDRRAVREGSGAPPVRAEKASHDLLSVDALETKGEIVIGGNLLTPGLASGLLPGVRWRFSFAPVGQPLTLLPGPCYSPWVPTSKLTTPVPAARATGILELPEGTVEFTDWHLSLGHNWGRRHTDSYVWGQVGQETDRGRFFFEGLSLPADPVAGGQPRVTVGKVRLAGEEIDFSGPTSWARNRAEVASGRWELDMSNRGWRLIGQLHWDPRLVAGLRYLQPDGGIRCCLNSMVADGVLALHRREGGADRELVRIEVQGTAALEFLTPRLDHGFAMLV
jgi:hypothetical protein